MSAVAAQAGEKRKRSTSPRPWHRHDRNGHRPNQRTTHTSEQSRRRPRQDQDRINQLQEDERMRQWVAQEDDFMLKQAKKKAVIRVKEKRAKPIDWLATLLRIVDPTRDLIDNEVDDEELEFVEPEGVFGGLADASLQELEKDIVTYLNLETNKKNKDYWRSMHIICKDQRQRLRAGRPETRIVGTVSSDIDRLLSPKSYDDLCVLEKQIERKLSSDEPIDSEYWQQLLDNLLVWKAKAKLRLVYRDVLLARGDRLRAENELEANRVGEQLRATINIPARRKGILPKDDSLDPAALLQLQPSDKVLRIMDESTFLDRLAIERHRLMQLDYVPTKHATSQAASSHIQDAHVSVSVAAQSVQVPRDNVSSATKTMMDREAAIGIGEDEEVFAGEEEVETRNTESWIGKYRPRKPKYFNRVQMGYEWNKYNQTHYDHDNPPPKVVQGYRFHIFYPDLIDITKAPTYKILREGGRRKGQSSAPAGEEDTCIIRFDSGPPYESIAFKIVDRDWDYSARHDRGFKSTFERGILTLHFSFKKIYYRK